MIMDLGLATIENYKQTRRQLQSVYEHAPEEDKRIVSSMISDCTYVVEWLKKGSRPPYRSQIGQPARESLWDPSWFQILANPAPQEPPKTLSEYQKAQVREALYCLSEKEMQCFLFKEGRGFTLEQVAKELNIAKGTVQSYLERARVKLDAFKAKKLSHAN
jgi:RNA polymerase sigma factor (sigma-70 family)